MAMGIDASRLEDLLKQGIELHKLNRFLEAEACYKEALALDPNNADAIHLLGLLADAIGDKDLAVDLIKCAISIQSSNAVFHNNLANILKSKNELDLAIACYQEALRIHPAYFEASFNLANLYRNLQMFDEAAPLYRQSIAINPDLAIARINLAETLHKTGQIEEAISSYKKYLELKSEDIYGKTKLADIFFEQGRKLEDQGLVDEATTSFEKALAVLPTHIPSRKKLDFLYSKSIVPADAIQFITDGQNKIRVFYEESLNGGGITFGQEYIAIIKDKYPNRLFTKCYEWCCGPGFIGFSILDHGLCKSLCLSDLHDPAIQYAEITVSHLPNEFKGKVTTYLLKDIELLPDNEKFDLVVSNPPHYSIYTPPGIDSWPEQISNNARRICLDIDWESHRNFFRHIKKHLLPNGIILLQENMHGSTLGAFSKSIRNAGLEVTDVFVSKNWFNQSTDLQIYYIEIQNIED